MSKSENKSILIIEDSPEDYETTKRALKKAKLKNPIYYCESGDEALDFLYHRGKYADPETSPRPGIILLDLNLPGTDGREVLRDIKIDHNLKSIPIIILTTSSDKRDIEKCYEDGANSYIQKPVNSENFFRAMQMLKDYWFEITILPDSE